MSSRHQIWLLSGGIGSGKSTVRRMLDGLGVRTIDADSAGHQVLAPGGAAVAEVASAWPEVVVDGEVSRSTLGDIVFADPAQLRRLEAITHPHIFSILSTQLENSDGPVVIEIPLLIQPFQNKYPRMVVDAPDAVRLQRAVDRGQSELDVRRRMEAQPSRAEWLAAADLIIPNSGSLADLESAVSSATEEVFGRH